ncbi:MAG TPA: acyl-CoA dehydrogenase, partial [Acidimicrobiia bacterium]|nr:acyl-CoA dehydrogenase [Acidimicrobiia bacterium]
MTDRPTVDEFRAEARAFLDEHAEPKREERFAWGQGSDRIGVLDEKSAEEEAREIADAKAWR